MYCKGKYYWGRYCCFFMLYISCCFCNLILGSLWSLTTQCISISRESLSTQGTLKSVVQLAQSRINNQMSQKKDKIWKVNLVILMKLRMPPRASHDWWCCGSLSTEPQSVTFKEWPSESYFIVTAKPQNMYNRRDEHMFCSHRFNDYL